MPDDSSPDFKASQSAHAADLKMQRDLVKHYGVTHSQARVALQQARAQDYYQRYSKAIQPQTTPVPNVPKVTTTETKLEPARLVVQAPPTAPRNPDGAGKTVSPSGTETTVTVCVHDEEGTHTEDVIFLTVPPPE